MRALSSAQRSSLEQVAAGRVTYGDPFPDRTRRIAKRQAGTATRTITGEEQIRPRNVWAYANFNWLIDGGEAYGQQARTFSSLEAAGLIVVHYDEIPDGDTGVARVTVTGG